MNQAKWISIGGNVEYENNELKYVPTIIEQGPSQGQFGFAAARSNLEFENGIISFKAKIKEVGAKCQLVLNHGKSEEVFIGLNLGNIAYGISIWKGGKWIGIDGAGDPKSLKIDEWIPLKIEVIGSTIRLYIDDILVCKGNYQITKCQIAFVFNGSQDILIKDVEIKSKQPQAFIVMQFTDEFNTLFDEVIKPVCEKYGLQCIRADDVYNSTQIIEDITRLINESYLIIADITPNNPNVYYELGYAHGIGKPTILLCEKSRERLPFDVSGFRTLFYHDSIGGKRAIEENLSKYLKTIMGKC